MTWFKVDDGFHSHPKVLEAGNEAIGLFVRCGSYCAQHLTEGLVPRAIALMYGDIALVDILVKAGLFTPVPTGWLISGGDRNFKSRGKRREEITNFLRHKVYERDGYACLRCGATSDLTLDHIYPWSLGGPDTFENLQTLCRPCNSSKGAKV